MHSDFETALAAGLSILESHPWLASVLDGLVALIGTAIGAIFNMIDLLENCMSIDFAIALVAIFVIANLIFEFALIISGVGFIASFVLGVIAILSTLHLTR